MLSVVLLWKFLNNRGGKVHSFNILSATEFDLHWGLCGPPEVTLVYFGDVQDQLTVAQMTDLKLTLITQDN